MDQWIARLLNGKTFYRLIAAGTLMVIGSFAGIAFGSAEIVVSQKGRAFAPGELSVKQGAIVRIVNDDSDLLHHAYIDADGFSFDSGDQDPGSKADIVFSVAGDFKVLCGIHPKMKLLVHVD